MHKKEVFNTHDFIKKACVVHDGVYDYSSVDYVSAKDKVSIICAKHGAFHQTPSNHLYGFGCSKCGVTKSHAEQSGRLGYTTKSYVDKAVSVHGDTYDYSEVEYTGSLNLITIKCRTHGSFHKTPSEHLAGAGCQKCGWDWRSRRE